MGGNWNAIWSFDMTQFNYAYKITSVDPSHKVMTVVYTSDAFGSLEVCARLPYEGEPLEVVLSAYSPAAGWARSLLPVASVSVGTSGELSYTSAAGGDMAIVAE
jgi:hypothetical protein